jgi:hypothetical protein
MTRRRFAMPCSFSSRKTARRYGFQGLLDLRSLAHRFHGLAAVEYGVYMVNAIDHYIGCAQLAPVRKCPLIEDL